MIQEYIALNRIIRKITYLTNDALYPPYEEETTTAILRHLKREIVELDRIWPKRLTTKPLTNLKKKFEYGTKKSFEICDEDIQWVEDTIDDYFSKQPISDVTVGILDFLHPAITTSSYSQFKDGHYREAVLNSIVAVFELIRKKTNLDRDGTALVDEVFSLTHPKLIFSELDSESGRNEQIGFMQILKGAFQGIRSPKAHSLLTDLDKLKTSQYLIFASLLARRIEEAHKVDS